MLEKIDADTLKLNPFTMIGKEWMLVAAEKDGKVNAMTASWGGLGVMWGKNVAFVFIRKSRYTKEFVDAGETLSLSFFDRPEFNEMLSYMGRVSGRDEDKIKNMNLTVAHSGATPYFEEAKTSFICKKMCCQSISPESFCGDDIMKFYADKDFHDMYIVEIQEVLTK